MNQQEAVDELWNAKREFRSASIYATTTQPVRMHEWNGKHPVEENTTIRTAPAGTRVLITMISRFGDVGIRDHHLVPPSHGYDARVAPEQLEAWDDRP